MKTGRTCRKFFLVLLALLAVLPYLNSLAGPWLLDDLPLVAHNPLLRDPARWPTLLTTDYWIVRGAPAGVYRPVPMLSFALNATTTGMRPLPFHVTNVLLHAAITLLLWVVLLRQGFAPISLFAALWFALHPVHTEAVANVVGRSELLVAAFFLAAWTVHLRANETGRQSLRLLECTCWLVLALSKENGVPLLVLPVIAWYVHGPKNSRALLLRTAPAFAAGVAYFVMRWACGIVTPELPQSYSIGERLQLVLSATAKNTQLLTGLFTHRAVYPIRDSFPSTLLIAGAVMLIALMGLVFISTWRRSAVALPAWAFFLSTITLLQLYPNTIWVWERGLYLPSLAFAWLVSNVRPKALSHGQLSRQVKTALAIGLLSFYAYQTTRFSRLYSGERLFWTHEFRQNPGHLPTVISYSEVLLKSPDSADQNNALRLRQNAVTQHPSLGFAYASLASAALRLQQPELARDALTSASEIHLEFPSAVQRRNGFRQLAALARQASLPDLAQYFLQRARSVASALQNSRANTEYNLRQHAPVAQLDRATDF